MRLYDITTETGDFIANGVISHNCYARPSHAYMGLSPGLDFETRLFYKADAAQSPRGGAGAPGLRLQADHARRQHRSLPAGRAAHARHALDPRGAVPHAPPGDRHHQERARAARSRPARRAGARSGSRAWRSASRRWMPSSSAGWSRVPRRRRRGCACCGNCAPPDVPAGVLVAPVIPALTDHEMEGILEAAARGRRPLGGLRAAAPAVRDQGSVHRVAGASISRSAPRTLCRWSATCVAGATTIRASARACAARVLTPSCCAETLQARLPASRSQVGRARWTRTRRCSARPPAAASYASACSAPATPGDAVEPGSCAGSDVGRRWTILRLTLHA